MDGTTDILRAMRIGYVVYRFPEISESFILDQMAGMVERGHHVGIYSASRPTDDPVHPSVAAHKLVERTRYLPRTMRTVRGMLGQAGRAVLAKPRESGRVLARSGKPFADRLRSLAKVHGFVWPRGESPEIVHCQFGCIARDFWLSKSLWNAKLVVSFRGHDFSSWPRMYGQDIFRELFQEVDGVMVVCRYAVPKLIALGCPPEKLIVHYSGTDVKDFAFRERTPDPAGTLRILTVARLEESKGLVFALRAVADLILRQGMDVRYGIVGGGTLRGELESLAVTLGIRERVTFFGPQARPRVRELLHQNDLFLLPSVTDREGGEEGIPGSVREAMATGMPIVSTLHSGIPELVDDGVSGFLVPERDVVALAARLHDLATHPEWWAAMGRRGRERVERDFEIHRLNRRLEAWYRHVLAGGVPAGFEFDEPVREALAEVAGV